MACLMEKIFEEKADKKIRELDDYLNCCPENIDPKEAKIIAFKFLGYDSERSTRKYEPYYNKIINESNNGGKINKEEFKGNLAKEIRNTYSPYFDL
ncbi:MAG: hypothetical protein ACP5OZ_04775 [Candidatus Woesearchaeota archaeon]